MTEKYNSIQEELRGRFPNMKEASSVAGISGTFQPHDVEPRGVIAKQQRKRMYKTQRTVKKTIGILNTAMLSELALEEGGLAMAPSTHRKRQLKESGHAFPVEVSRSWDADMLRRHLKVLMPVDELTYLIPHRDEAAPQKEQNKSAVGFKYLQPATGDLTGDGLLTRYPHGSWFYVAEVNVGVHA